MTENQTSEQTPVASEEGTRLSFEEHLVLPTGEPALPLQEPAPLSTVPVEEPSHPAREPPFTTEKSLPSVQEAASPAEERVSQADNGACPAEKQFPAAEKPELLTEEATPAVPEAALREEPSTAAVEEAPLACEEAMPAPAPLGENAASAVGFGEVQPIETLVKQKGVGQHSENGTAAEGAAVMDEEPVAAGLTDHNAATNKEDTTGVSRDKPEKQTAAAETPQKDTVEAGAVTPTVAQAVQPNAKDKEREDRGDNHSKDQPGQGKTEDEIFLESSLSNQQAEKEALKKVIEEKVAVKKEYKELKARYAGLEEDSKRWETEIAGLKEKLQKQAQRIQELEANEKRLQEFEEWGKANEAKVKDLQNRLAVLAGEDAEKAHHIQKLQKDLQESTSKPVAANRQAVASSPPAQQEHPLESKTCIVM